MKSATHARLFLALDPPAALCDGLARWAREARRGRISLRVLDSDRLHLTMCFLGARALEDVEPIEAAMLDSAAPVPSLAVGAPVWLPPRRPRALAVEVRDEGEELVALRHDLGQRLAAALDWEPERRRHRPHITVARMREGRAPGQRTLPPTPAERFRAESLTLYRSWLHPSGASYEPLARVELGDP